MFDSLRFRIKLVTLNDWVAVGAIAYYTLAFTLYIWLA